MSDVDRRSEAIASLLVYTRREYGTPVALIVHPDNAGALAPYAVMYDLELRVNDQVGKLELRVRWAGAEDDDGGGESSMWDPTR